MVFNRNRLNEYKRQGGVKGGVSDFTKEKTAENQRFQNPYVELEGLEPFLIRL